MPLMKTYVIICGKQIIFKPVQSLLHSTYTIQIKLFKSYFEQLYLYGDIHLFSGFLFLYIPVSLYHIHCIIA